MIKIARFLSYLWYVVVLGAIEWGTGYLCFAYHSHYIYRTYHWCYVHNACAPFNGWGRLSEIPFILLSLIEFIIICVIAGTVIAEHMEEK